MESGPEKSQNVSVSILKYIIKCNSAQQELGVGRKLSVCFSFNFVFNFFVSKVAFLKTSISFEKK